VLESAVNESQLLPKGSVAFEWQAHFRAIVESGGGQPEWPMFGAKVNAGFCGPGSTMREQRPGNLLAPES
jgi:hypothetical protein